MSKRQTLGWTRKETSSGDNQKLTAQGEFFFTKAVGQKTEVTDALKARRQRVDEKAADKFIGSERHPARLLFVPVAVVFRLKRDFALFRRRPSRARATVPDKRGRLIYQQAEQVCRRTEADPDGKHFAGLGERGGGTVAIELGVLPEW